MTAGDIAGPGLGFGLLVAAFWFGFRHGIDFDHLAAITDITGSTEDRGRAVFLGTLYALGHGLVVLVLGVLAILAGERLPRGVDEVMTRVVGVTLVLLGVYVIVSLVRHGRDFQLRSRWMLVFVGVRRGWRWVSDRARARRPVSVGPGGGLPMSPVDPQDELVDAVEPAMWHHGHHGRPGHHHHRRPEPDDGVPSYGRATALAVGMIHGIGAETPTQVLIFLTAAGAGGPLVGVLVLVAFIAGLLGSNSLITVGSAVGFLRASRNFPVYATVAIVTAAFSLFIGTVFVLGATDLLPHLFA
ncbi:MAG: hypothetical protein ACRDI0_06335 [Actinomycetota bacterium]